jgi:hypothetical protein
MIGIGAAGARGTNGTLNPATARTRSGACTASCQTTFAPQSCPTNTASLAPTASSRPVMSPHRLTMSYASTASGAELSP